MPRLRRCSSSILRCRAARRPAWCASNCSCWQNWASASIFPLARRPAASRRSRLCVAEIGTRGLARRRASLGSDRLLRTAAHSCARSPTDEAVADGHRRRLCADRFLPGAPRLRAARAQPCRSARKLHCRALSRCPPGHGRRMRERAGTVPGPPWRSLPPAMMPMVPPPPVPVAIQDASTACSTGRANSAAFAVAAPDAGAAKLGDTAQTPTPKPTNAVMKIDACHSPCFPRRRRPSASMVWRLRPLLGPRFGRRRRDASVVGSSPDAPSPRRQMPLAKS